MKCNCIDEAINVAKEHAIEQKLYKKPVIDADMKGVGLVMRDNKIVQHSFSEVEVTLEGQKRKPVMKIFHSYCPFCGKKIKDDEDDS